MGDDPTFFLVIGCIILAIAVATVAYLDFLIYKIIQAGNHFKAEVDGINRVVNSHLTSLRFLVSAVRALEIELERLRDRTRGQPNKPSKLVFSKGLVHEVAMELGMEAKVTAGPSRATSQVATTKC